MISIETYGKQIIWNPVNKEKVHQLHLGHVTHPFLKKHRTNRDQVIIIFQSSFKLVTLKCIKNELSKNNVLVISLMIFYENRTKVMYKVIGSVIYTIIHECICLDYLGLFQKPFPNRTIFSKILSSTICLGWEYLRFWWISCHIMYLLNLQYQQLSWHDAMT